MIRIRTPSRLHFGLFSLPSAQLPDGLQHGSEALLPRRRFGGVGLMTDRPGIELTVERAASWSAEGPLAERALQFGQRFCEAVGIQQAFAVRIEAAAPEHAGLGTGTQLGLAVAAAMTDLATDTPRIGRMLAPLIGRGARSAIGVHGFDWGGFIVEGGKRSDDELAPLLIRRDFPKEWRVLLITPRDLQGAHGLHEASAFAELAHATGDEQATDALCRLVLLGMLPALVEVDLPAFGEALYEFNRRVGEMFRPVQGGVYAHPRIEALVKAIRAAGVKAVGQSSWGPTVFAIVETGQVTDLREWLIRQKMITPEEVIATWACNHGATGSG